LSEEARQSGGTGRRPDWRLARFVYDTLIAPWPPFIFILAAVGLLGALLPLIEVQAVAGLIDALTRGRRAAPPAADTFAAALKPYLPWVLLLIGVRAAEWIIYMESFQQYVAAQLNERVRECFDRRFFQKTLAARLELFESPAYFDAMQRARQGMNERAVADQITHLQRLASLTLGCLAILWVLGQAHWAVPVLLLAGSVVLLRWHVRQEREMIAIDYSQTPLQRRRDYWRGLLTEQSTAAEVRLFGLAQHFVRAWAALTGQLLKEIATARHRNLRRGVPVTLANLGLFGAVAWLLINVAAGGGLTAGKLVALVYALQAYLERIHMVSWRLERTQKFFAGLRQAAAFLALAGEESQVGVAAPTVAREGVRLEGVGFTYPGASQPALVNVNLHIRPGERVALVGENGAGKTTLAKLLLGLYRPTAGRITVAGVDLDEIAPDSWRARVGAVFQDFSRYALTARENIGFGRLDKLDDARAIEAAARMSSAAEFIERLPRRYETVLGKQFAGGHELSTGQWQKLAAARVYLRDPELLVLDEPASALDALAEQELYRRFLELSHGKTMLLISHRLGSARLADRILFLQQGRVIEEGTHDELLARGGSYAELYELQAQWYTEQVKSDAVGAAE
jgi:ABC-type multidrug transport system fused ATPase/permease subunit